MFKEMMQIVLGVLDTRAIKKQCPTLFCDTL